MTENPVDGTPITFTSQRMNVALLVLLLFVTCGLIGPAWFLMRRRFLDSLRASEKIGQTLPVINLVIFIVVFLLSVLNGAGVTGIRPDSFLMTIANLVVIIPYVMLTFRSRRMLQQHVARGQGFYPQLSFAGTFFLGIFYLQYKINQIADSEQESQQSGEPIVG